MNAMKISHLILLILSLVFVSFAYAVGAEPEHGTIIDGKWLGGILIAALLGALQALCLFILVGLRGDIKQLWNRANSHGHEIECDSKTCKPRTVSVTVHEG